MAPAHPRQPAHRLLVVMPTWLGDVVMATPTLRALRQLHPDAHIAGLIGAPLEPIVDGLPWVDRWLTAPPDKAGLWRRARTLAAERFDTAVLLPNSFRSALLVRLARIPRRIGYDRDGRGPLLTDRLIPRRGNRGFIPVPTRDYYLGLARYLGATDPDPRMELATRPGDEARADELLATAGHDRDAGRPLVLINPGANYGDAKMWYPDRFATVADRCSRELGAAIAITGAPKERAILDQVLAAATEPMIDLPALGLDLRVLKAIIRRAHLLITNDTGPRHLAAAFDTPVITIFGPTDPAWTVIGFQRERQVMVNVPCGPCQLKRCPLDHRCMTRIEPDMVYRKALELLPPVGATA